VLQLQYYRESEPGGLLRRDFQLSLGSTRSSLNPRFVGLTTLEYVPCIMFILNSSRQVFIWANMQNVLWAEAIMKKSMLARITHKCSNVIANVGSLCLYFHLHKC